MYGVVKKLPTELCPHVWVVVENEQSEKWILTSLTFQIKIELPIKKEMRFLWRIYMNAITVIILSLSKMLQIKFVPNVADIWKQLKPMIKKKSLGSLFYLYQ